MEWVDVTDVHIRPRTPEDTQALRHLYFSERTALFSGFNPDWFLAHDFDKDTQGEKIFVATVHEQIVGFISVWEADPFVHHLYVTAQYQGKGIGKRLHDTAISVLKRPVILKCLKRNAKAIVFYSTLGWVLEGKGMDDFGEYVLFTLK